MRDSIVEVLPAAAIAWQFAAPDPERRERTALRIIPVFAAEVTSGPSDGLQSP